MVRRCNNCGKEIQDNRNYAAHVQRCVHNRTKTLCCDLCGKRYSYRSSMYLHKRVCHSRPSSGRIVAGVYKIDCVEKKEKKRLDIKINPRRTRISRLGSYTSQQPLKNDKDKSKHKYVMCLRTKTCQLIKAENEAVDDEHEDETETDALAENHDNDDDIEYEVEEYEIEEVIIPDDNETELKDKSDIEEVEDDDVVVLEDYGYFNKVEVRKNTLTVKAEDGKACEGIEEFIDFKSIPRSRKN